MPPDRRRRSAPSTGATRAGPGTSGGLRPSAEASAASAERRSRRGKIFFGCAAYPDCDFVLWRRPVDKACPDCGRTYLVERVTKRSGRQLVCDSENCDHIETADAAEAVQA